MNHTQIQTASRVLSELRELTGIDTWHVAPAPKGDRVFDGLVFYLEENLKPARMGFRMRTVSVILVTEVATEPPKYLEPDELERWHEAANVLRTAGEEFDAGAEIWFAEAYLEDEDVPEPLPNPRPTLAGALATAHSMILARADETLASAAAANAHALELRALADRIGGVAK